MMREELKDEEDKLTVQVPEIFLQTFWIEIILSLSSCCTLPATCWNSHYKRIRL